MYDFCSLHHMDLHMQMLELEASVLRDKINSPEIMDFLEAVKLEAVNQKSRWGEEHDKGKSPEDWLWVIEYLSTKATQASKYEDNEKYLHHIITTAAACLNWHKQVKEREGWKAGLVRCTSCGHRSVSVRHVETITGLECPGCGKMHMVEDIDTNG